MQWWIFYPNFTLTRRQYGNIVRQLFLFWVGPFTAAAKALLKVVENVFKVFQALFFSKFRKYMALSRLHSFRTGLWFLLMWPVSIRCSQAASLEDAFSPDMDFPLSLPLSDAEETAVVRPSETEPEPNPDLHASACVSCDHNYTVEDTVQQKRRIEQLQEQLEKLRKRLKTVQQKCRRQERQLERYRAMSQIRKTGKKDVTPGESYVILPREIYDVLKGIETIGALWGFTPVLGSRFELLFLFFFCQSWLVFWMSDVCWLTLGFILLTCVRCLTDRRTQCAFRSWTCSNVWEDSRPFTSE